MHLAAGIWKNNVDMRLDKNIKIDIYNLQDKKELKSLRFNNSWKKIRYLKVGLLDKEGINMFVNQSWKVIDRGRYINLKN